MQNYFGVKCPVCEKAFTENDDIVTCPKCGAPYHRHCYFEKGECIFTELHDAGKTWEAPEPDRSLEQGPAVYEIKDQECPKCGILNNHSSLFCSSCGSPLKIEPSTHANSQYVQGNFQPMPPMYGMNGLPIAFDPMGGVKPSDMLDENISFGEVSKVVQQNTRYYMPVFSRIKNLGKGKFNFCAFLFSGAWLLYRKQYKSGIIFTILMFGLYFGQMFTTARVFMPTLTRLLEQTGQQVGEMGPTVEQIAVLFSSYVVSSSDMFLILIPYLFSFLSLLVMIFVGIRGNRMYMKHCIKAINHTRKTTQNSEDYNTRILEKGGVNTSVIVCLMICYFLASYLTILL